MHAKNKVQTKVREKIKGLHTHNHYTMTMKYNIKDPIIKISFAMQLSTECNTAIR